MLVAPGCHVFRGNNIESALARIIKQEELSDLSNASSYYPFVRKKTEIAFLYEIYDCLKDLENYTIRVEGVWLSIYSNNDRDISKIRRIRPDHVKSIYSPPKPLTDGEIISNVPYDFKVTLRNIDKDHSAFVEWAKSNENIKLLKSCEDSLTYYKKYLNSPSYFYVKGEKTLLMTKIHLGDVIRVVERIVKP